MSHIGANTASFQIPSRPIFLFKAHTLTVAFSIFRKDQEFRTWLVEERKINPETISKEQEKKEFARFAEDYNTGIHLTSLCSTG
jgi:hypothetical protein